VSAIVDREGRATLILSQRKAKGRIGNTFRTVRVAPIILLVAWICFLAPGLGLAPVEAAGTLSVLEEDLFEEINLARTDPGTYMTFLKEFRGRYAGKKIRLPGNLIILSREGVQAVDEAFQALNDTNPMSPLKWSRGMSMAAGDHVEEQGRTGKVGHPSADGSQPWDRIKRYGTARGLIGENIAYGKLSARIMVLGLIIDDGIPDRGHRKNIFNPKFGIAGIACGDHPRFGIMCVIDFAGDYIEKAGNRR
jgi:uncharacterized protein YkwD